MHVVVLACPRKPRCWALNLYIIAAFRMNRIFERDHGARYTGAILRDPLCCAVVVTVLTLARAILVQQCRNIVCLLQIWSGSSLFPLLAVASCATASAVRAPEAGTATAPRPPCPAPGTVLHHEVLSWKILVERVRRVCSLRPASTRWLTPALAAVHSSLLTHCQDAR